MTASGRVVIVGAGVVGASVAWHLVRAGAREVVIVDGSEGPGRGSTGAATGGFRAQFASAINVRLSLLAREKLVRFRDEVRGDPGYDPAGYLWLAGSATELDALRAARAIQKAEGLHEAEEVTPEEIGRLQPAASLDGVVGGSYCPTDGYLRPLSILSGYLDAAVRAGARLEWGAPVRAFERAPDGAIRAVSTDAARFGCDVVVNAAGAWAGQVARLAGVEIPVVPLRRQVAMTVPTTAIPEGSPMTIWCSDGFHLRPRDGRVLLAFPAPGDPADPWSIAVDRTWLDEVRRRADERVPALRSVGLDPAAGWGGLYELSPDKHAILGFAEGCGNLLLVNGSSGHGVMHAPALGQLAAEILLEGRARTLDVTPLRPSRFAEGAANPVEPL